MDCVLSKVCISPPQAHPQHNVQSTGCMVVDLMRERERELEQKVVGAVGGDDSVLDSAGDWSLQRVTRSEPKEFSRPSNIGFLKWAGEEKL